MDNKDNYSAEALKERGHGVIEESKWENFDKMVDNNCKSWMGLRYVDSVLLLCEIMHNETIPLTDRRRQAYDKFQEFDCNGTSAHMICGALRDLCTDGETLAEEILDFKYDPNGSLSERRKYRERMQPVWEQERKIREDLKSHMFICDFKVRELGTDKVLDIVPVYSTRSGMFLIEYPYKYRLEDCLKITQQIGRSLGMCYGVFNGVPMFSFDTYDTFFRRQHNGMTQEDYAEFMDALRPEHYDSEKASRILKERTWPHLGKTT